MNISEKQAMDRVGQIQSLGESILQQKDFVLVEDSAGNSLTMGSLAEALEDVDGMSRSGTAIMIKNLWEWHQSLDETTKIVNVGDFDKFAYPMVTIVYPNLVAHNLVSVQPMDGPTSIIFYLQALYNASKAPTVAGDNMITNPNPMYASEEIEGEVVATGTNSTGPYTGTAAWIPVSPNTVVITDGTETFTDNGSGTLTGDLGGSGTIVYATGAINVTFNGAVGTGVPITANYEYDQEGNTQVPEVDLNLVQTPVTARSRKLGAKWTLEGAFNLKKLHGRDAEVELVAACTNELKFGVDQGIITDVWNGTSQTQAGWSQTPDTGVSYAEHQLSFVRTLIQASNKIFDGSGRAVGEWVVAGIDVASVIEALPGYEATGKLTGRGIYESGMLNGNWRIVKNSYFTATNYLMGYKGGSMFDTGYVFSPYLLFYTTPTYTLMDFITRKGFATMSGKKMVDNTFFCRGSVTA